MGKPAITPSALATQWPVPVSSTPKPSVVRSPRPMIRGRSGSHLPRLPVRTVHETFISHGSRQLVPCHGYC
ncbi:MAG: hypothetical protein MK111_08990 [Crocosphaera sp.]|uniref:hypothetical protein n=1 Tax=Crocosphaera TaxID=263510 RepID=UPI001E39356D|nr:MULTISPECIES: hypothetical protein [Crocosphaera]MCH2244761.1 hypothetical protein [Crocosphaera sp.]